jgi:hypothetical protein
VTLLQFVSDHSQKFLARFDVGVGFDTLGLHAVDDAEDAAVLLAFAVNSFFN